MKDMTSAATTMMSEEEKAELEKQMNGGLGSSEGLDAARDISNAPFQAQSHQPPSDATDSAKISSPSSPLKESDASPAPPTAYADAETSSTIVVGSSSAPPSSPSSSDKLREREKLLAEKEVAAKKRVEQQKKLKEQEKERKKVMEARVNDLTKKLIERLRPFVQAKNPGVLGDPETLAFTEKMKKEAEDLKLESFGVELLHTIGSVYIMKGTSYMKSKKFLGM